MTESATPLSTVASLDEDWPATVNRRSLEILERRRNGATDRRRGRVVRRALAASDVLGLALAFLAAQLLFSRSAGPSNRVDLVDESLIFLATLPLWIVTARLYGLYDRDEERTDHSTVDDLVGVFHLVTVGAWVLLVGIKAAGVAELSLWKLVTFWGLAVVLITLGRALARMLCRRSASYVQNTVIVGTGRIAERIARKIQQHPEYGLQFVGYVDGPAGDTNGHGVAKSPQEWRLLVRFLAFTGLRVGEALALQCRHVDFGRRRVLVRRRVYEGRFAKPKSSYGRRDVPVSAAIKAARDESDDGLVFCRDDGGLIHPSTVLRAVQDAGGKAGVPWVTTHCLRHTCATMLFRKGVNPKQAQVWLGHHSPAFTLAVYTHLIDSDCPTRT